MNVKIMPLVSIVLATISFNTLAQCDASQEPPSDKPSNFNINEHLSKFSEMGDTIQNMPPIPGFDAGWNKRLAAGVFLSSAFYTDNPYDLKNNPVYNASNPDRFTNWFFGAAAGQLGFSSAEAKTAAAIVQQAQDYTNGQHPDYRDFTRMAEDIVSALWHFDGTEDNFPDSMDIEGGYGYQRDAYENDTPSGKSSGNSCDNDDSNDSADSSSANAGSGSGYGGGWGGGYFVGSAGCYGACGSGAVGSVTITDLPRQETIDE
ncbi:hypothetical protein [Alteromonas sp. CNT1-28]|jgi:hypothetical protein|uniref:Lipoprotein n=3 Tax=Alteromonas macleodii TaxID=28108 RepID=A0AB36FLF5_ALTMA|nr:hypothetical protein [Alteromonas sp. CNT1-28]OES23834.1 hypothetical protein BFV95_4919 [Alteromonas macleodii]MCG7639314.1 hypothetical protein [Alteromonas sp. CNT1-28]OES24540.1 hypothetical protein BFV94_4691 [Alteromonas macleodii]OES25179.1 hypothetical protein BFV93_4510 [Alteromonas macleodii]OES38502.1 hypothetical protein BFV96_4913 [Alteromonas macleodii]